jgi:hypothetical protein
MLREGKMDVLIVVGAMALAAAIMILVDIVALRRSDYLIQTLVRAYRNSWRHSHKL